MRRDDFENEPEPTRAPGKDHKRPEDEAATAPANTGEAGDGGTSSLESLMSDLGYTDEGAAKDFERQGDATDFTRRSQDADFVHEVPGTAKERQATAPAAGRETRGAAPGQQAGATGPKPYAGAHTGVSSGSSGHAYQGGSMEFNSGRYIGMGKIAKQMGIGVQELRSCAQSQGIVPDKHKRSCDMYTHSKAEEIMQACGTGFNPS